MARLAFSLDVPPHSVVVVLVFAEQENVNKVILREIGEEQLQRPSNDGPMRAPDRVDRNPMIVQRYIDECGLGIVVNEDGLRIEVRPDEVCTWCDAD